jgi:hypothetical protein
MVLMRLNSGPGNGRTIRLYRDLADKYIQAGDGELMEEVKVQPARNKKAKPGPKSKPAEIQETDVEDGEAGNKGAA